MSERKYFKANLNDYVKVRLNDYGMCVYKSFYAKYGLDAPQLKMDEEGYVEFQVWDFINIFGDSMHMGGQPPCDLNVLIQIDSEGGHV